MHAAANPAGQVGMSHPGQPEHLPPLIPWWPRPMQASPTRLERIPDRGAAATGILVLATLAWVALAGSMVLAALGSTLAMAIIAGAVLASATAILLRAWSVGTYANDAGFAVRRALRTRAGRWSQVDGIEVGPRRTVIVQRDATIPTHIRRWSLDLLGRQEAYEAAADRLMRWYLHQ
jgi:hypothetical protein